MWAMARWENKMIWMSLEENIKTIFSALKERVFSKWHNRQAEKNWLLVVRALWSVMTYTGLYDNLQPLAKNAWSHLAPKLNIIKRNLHICNHCLHPSLPLVLLSTLDLIHACLFPHFHLHIHKQGGGEEDFHKLANPVNRFIISCEYQHVNVTQWQLNLISPNHFIGRSERSIVRSYFCLFLF